MEVVAHRWLILYLIYIYYTRLEYAKQSQNECESAPGRRQDQKTNRIRRLSSLEIQGCGITAVGVGWRGWRILPQHPSDQHRPEQDSRRDDRLLSAIAGFGQVPLQAETINDEAARRTWRGHGQRRWGDSCLRARISSSALAVSTSRNAS